MSIMVFFGPKAAARPGKGHHKVRKGGWRRIEGKKTRVGRRKNTGEGGRLKRGDVV